MQLDGGTFLLQFAAGGLLFGWVTTRRRIVSLGYGWLIRIVYGLLAIGGGVWLLYDDEPVTAAFAFATAFAAAVALAVSVVRRRAGVSGHKELKAERKARVAAMVGDAGAAEGSDVAFVDLGPEYPPVLDFVAALVGFAGLFVAADVVGGPYALAVARLVVGAAFLGSVTDAMLLGHWYLVQPGLPREPVRELVKWVAIVWPFELLVFLIPTGMVQVFNGTVDDGYDGILGWMWAVCAVTTIGLVAMTWFALKEKAYAAVMAATGLLYLAILTAFGVDLVARAVLNP